MSATNISAATSGADWARERVLQLALAGVMSQAIYCAVELQLADQLVDGPVDLAVLAARLGCSASHLERLVKALACIGLFKFENHRLAATPLSNWLRRDVKNSLWPVVSFYGNEMHKSLNQLPLTVRTGARGWDAAFGMPFWSYLAENPNRGQVFDDMMAALCEPELEAIVAAYDFSRVRTLVDVGGGNGSVVKAVLRKYRSIRAIVFDSTKAGGHQRVQELDERWTERLRFETGNFFAGVPRADAYLLRHVIHDWDDTGAVAILGACRAAGGRGAVLLVIEDFLDERDPSRTQWMDLGMMVNFGSKERTLAEYRALCEAASFEVARVVRTNGPVSILECIAR